MQLVTLVATSNWRGPLSLLSTNACTVVDYDQTCTFGINSTRSCHFEHCSIACRGQGWAVPAPIGLSQVHRHWQELNSSYSLFVTEVLSMPSRKQLPFATRFLGTGYALRCSVNSKALLGMIVYHKYRVEVGMAQVTPLGQNLYAQHCRCCAFPPLTPWQAVPLTWGWALDRSSSLGGWPVWARVEMALPWLLWQLPTQIRRQGSHWVGSCQKKWGREVPAPTQTGQPAKRKDLASICQWVSGVSSNGRKCPAPVMPCVGILMKLMTWIMPLSSTEKQGTMHNCWMHSSILFP